MSELDSARRPLSGALFPWPQRLREEAERLRLAPCVRLLLETPAQEDCAAVDWLERALEARGHRLERVRGAAASVPAPGSIRVAAFDTRLFERDAGELGAQSYRLCVKPAEGIFILCAGAAALQYALATLVQMVGLAQGAPGQIELPGCVIEDWPDFAARGVMLDISRDKVPTLDGLKALVERLARWKLNQLQLYMEHTFAYPGHEPVWQHASPLTGEEIRALDAHCAAHHVELVPNQNSFGHMQRWLVHAQYRALAECPDGFEHPWNWGGEPYGLCATDPASLRFLEGLYDALLPNFSSRSFNVGLDETLDLGAGRSKAACAARGTERVYLEFLREVHQRVRARGKLMQFWGDIVITRPDLLSELPEEAIALVWGYEADHPFAEQVALLRGAGLACHVCPGTSSWNSIAGRTENALLNLARAAREGKRAGASGYLITDWGDHGHLQPLAVSYLGLFVGAGFCWNVGSAEQPLALDVPSLLDQHVFFDAAGVLGRAAYELGNAYRHAGSLRPNASVLFWALIRPERLFTPAGVDAATLAHTLAHLERAGAALSQARPLHGSDPRECARVQAELTWACDLLCFACRLGSARCTLPERGPVQSVPEAVRAALAAELGTLVERHRALWRARNRPGGLDDSARRLERILDDLSSPGGTPDS